jgi:hypothetical protein
MASETEVQDYFSMMSRAQALMDIERWGEAVAILNKGLSANPDNHWILCSLAFSQLRKYIHLERGRALRGFVLRAVGGGSLVVLVWRLIFWQDDSAPQTVTSWLFFIALCATTIVSAVLLWRNWSRTP